MESIAQVRIETDSCLDMLKPLHHLTSLNYDWQREVNWLCRHSFVCQCRVLGFVLHFGLKWGTGFETTANQFSGHGKPMKCNDIQRVIATLFEREFTFIFRSWEVSVIGKTRKTALPSASASFGSFESLNSSTVRTALLTVVILNGAIATQVSPQPQNDIDTFL